MAQDLGMTRDQVNRQLKELTDLLDLVDTQTQPIKTAKERQHAAVWSDIDGCAAFGASYTATIGEIEYALKDIRDSVGIALVNLHDSADTVSNQDEAIRAAYANLAKRIDLGAPASGGLTDFRQLIAIPGAPTGPLAPPAAAPAAPSTSNGGIQQS